MNIILRLLGHEIARIEIDLRPLLNAITPPAQQQEPGQVFRKANGHKPVNRLVLRASDWWAAQMFHPNA